MQIYSTQRFDGEQFCISYSVCAFVKISELAEGQFLQGYTILYKISLLFSCRVNGMSNKTSTSGGQQNASASRVVINKERYSVRECYTINRQANIEANTNEQIFIPTLDVVRQKDRRAHRCAVLSLLVDIDQTIDPNEALDDTCREPFNNFRGIW